LTDIVLLGGAIIDGLLLGGIYALAALGISLTFSVTNLLNLSHGNLIMMGAVLTFVFYSLLGGSAPVQWQNGRIQTLFPQSLKNATYVYP